LCKIEKHEPKSTKIYPLPHMYVIKDLVPVSVLMMVSALNLFHVGFDKLLQTVQVD
jgi:succinate dehydrogenase/fumarate reductase-like Fe-S protein